MFWVHLNATPESDQEDVQHTENMANCVCYSKRGLPALVSGFSRAPAVRIASETVRLVLVQPQLLGSTVDRAQRIAVGSDVAA